MIKYIFFFLRGNRKNMKSTVVMSLNFFAETLSMSQIWPFRIFLWTVMEKKSLPFILIQKMKAGPNTYVGSFFQRSCVLE